MPVAANDVLRVALQWFIDGTDEVINVHTMQVTGISGTPTDLEIMEDIRDALATAVYAAVEAEMANNLIGAAITAINLTQGLVMPPVDNPIDGLNSGGITGAHQVTALGYLNGNQARRQGRSYLPPFTNAETDDAGNWDTGALGSIAAYVAALLSAISGSHATYQRVICNAAGGAVLVPTQGGFPGAPRTQRRRTKGRGS